MFSEYLRIVDFKESPIPRLLSKTTDDRESFSGSNLDGVDWIDDGQHEDYILRQPFPEDSNDI